MDGADPEKRIAELERQLAEARAAGDGADRGALTPDQVRDTAFAKPPLGRRGYNEVEVDAFLDRVEAALRDPAAHTLTPEQVRNVAFSKPRLGRRGYNEVEVDAFLDRVEAALAGPKESDTLGMHANEESAASEEPIRCRIIPALSRKRKRLFAIEVAKDVISVSDPNTNALITSARLAEVTATPAAFTFVEGGGMDSVANTRTQPVLLVHVPGLEPIIIGTPAMNEMYRGSLQYRFSWRGNVAKAKRPVHFVTESEFRTLAGKFGLAQYLYDRTNTG